MARGGVPAGGEGGGGGRGTRGAGRWGAGSVVRAIGAALGVAAWAAAAEGAPAKIGLGDLTRPQAARAIFRTCSLCSENSGLMGFLRERVEPGGFGERVRVKWVPGEEPELSVVAENMSPLAVYRVGSLGSGEVEQLLAEWGFPPKAPPGHGGDTQGGGGHGQDMLRGGGGGGVEAQGRTRRGEALLRIFFETDDSSRRPQTRPPAGAVRPSRQSSSNPSPRSSRNSGSQRRY